MFIINQKGARATMEIKIIMTSIGIFLNADPPMSLRGGSFVPKGFNTRKPASRGSLGAVIKYYTPA
jgi:hypothetical protein